MEKSDKNTSARAFENLPLDKRKRLVASIQGTTVEQKHIEEQNWERSKKYRNLALNEWPEFELLWDKSKDSVRYCLDGFDEETYKLKYPNGMILGNINFSEFQDKMSSFNNRDKTKIWELGNPYKLARAILHLVDKNKITPIFIGVFNNELTIWGGFHRHAICMVKNPERIPILTLPEHKQDIEKIARSIVWEDFK